jgi:hypothetical protein
MPRLPGLIARSVLSAGQRAIRIRIASSGFAPTPRQRESNALGAKLNRFAPLGTKRRQLGSSVGSQRAQVGRGVSSNNQPVGGEFEPSGSRASVCMSRTRAAIAVLATYTAATEASAARRRNQSTATITKPSAAGAFLRSGRGTKESGFILPHFLEPASLANPEAPCRVAWPGSLGGSGFGGVEPDPGGVPGPFGIAVPYFVCKRSRAARIRPARSLSKAAVGTGKIWSVTALRTVTRIAFGNCTTSCHVSCGYGRAREGKKT